MKTSSSTFPVLSGHLPVSWSRPDFLRIDFGHSIHQYQITSKQLGKQIATLRLGATYR